MEGGIGIAVDRGMTHIKTDINCPTCDSVVSGPEVAHKCPSCYAEFEIRYSGKYVNYLFCPCCGAAVPQGFTFWMTVDEAFGWLHFLEYIKESGAVRKAYRTMAGEIGDAVEKALFRLTDGTVEKEEQCSDMSKTHKHLMQLCKTRNEEQEEK